MKMPQMVLLDYGQTLISEQKFDGVRKCLQITAASLWQFFVFPGFCLKQLQQLFYDNS